MPENEQRDIPENEQWGSGKERKRSGWKTFLMALVVLAVVGSLVQVVARSGGFGGALDTTGDGPDRPEEGEPREVKPSKKPKTVKLGGSTVPRTAGTVVVVNPGLVAPGGRATIEGAGFDPGAAVDILLKTSKSATKGKTLNTVKASKGGAITAPFHMPESAGGRATTVVAQQRDGDKAAEARLTSRGGIGTVKLSKMVGKPGDSVSLSARGFSPGETIGVYWGRVGGTPVTTLRADEAGGIGREDIKVGIAPTGTSTLVLFGRKSKTTATAPFQMLGLYPSVKPTPYAAKSGQQMRMSAKGFAPGERVLFYINAASGIPAFTTQADGGGKVRDVAFVLPFGMKGEQKIAAIGEQTRAVVRAAFRVLPYSPSAEPSTFGGKPGTTLSFYVSGFAPNETVTIYAGGTEGGGGRKAGTFQVDGRGKAAAVGSYRITPEDANGVSFRLVGQKSGGTAEASVNSSQGQGQDKDQ